MWKTQRYQQLFPSAPTAGRNPENESPGCIFTGTRAAVPGYVAAAFRRESEKTGSKCWIFAWLDCREPGPYPNGPKKFVENSQKKQGLGQHKGAKNIF